MIAFAAILVMASGASLTEYAVTGSARTAAASAGLSWLIVGIGALIAWHRGRR